MVSLFTNLKKQKMYNLTEEEKQKIHTALICASDSGTLDEFTKEELSLINEAESIVNKLTIPVVTHRTCYNCKFCMYESKKPKHAQFTCLGTIDLNNITDPHHHICKLWDE